MLVCSDRLGAAVLALLFAGVRFCEKGCDCLVGLAICTLLLMARLAALKGACGSGGA